MVLEIVLQYLLLSNPKELKHRHQGRYLDTLGMLVSTVSLYTSVQFSQFCPVYVAYFALSLASIGFFFGRPPLQSCASTGFDVANGVTAQRVHGLALKGRRNVNFHKRISFFNKKTS